MRDPEGRAVRGVISAVTPSVVVLVSLHGERSRLAPESLASAWTFITAPPRTIHACNVNGCDACAVFRYFRNGSNLEYTCPRHFPIGVTGEILPDQTDVFGHIPEAEPRTVPRCYDCGSELTDSTLDTNGMPPFSAEWSCRGCGSRCFIVTPRADVQNPPLWYLQAVMAIREFAQHQGEVISQIYAGHEALRNLQLALTPYAPPANLQTMILWESTPIHLSHALPQNHFRLQVRSSPVETNFPEAASNIDTQERTAAENQIRAIPRWIHRGQGRTVKVQEVANGAVAFSMGDQSFRMVIEDFLHFHRPFDLDNVANPPPDEPLPEMAPEDEWTSVEGTVTILDVDSKREIVSCKWAHGSHRTAQINLRDFAIPDKWRKVLRTTSFQKILDDEDD